MQKQTPLIKYKCSYVFRAGTAYLQFNLLLEQFTFNVQQASRIILQQEMLRSPSQLDNKTERQERGWWIRLPPFHTCTHKFSYIQWSFFCLSYPNPLQLLQSWVTRVSQKGPILVTSINSRYQNGNLLGERG